MQVSYFLKESNKAYVMLLLYFGINVNELCMFFHLKIRKLWYINNCKIKILYIVTNNKG